MHVAGTVRSRASGSGSTACKGRVQWSRSKTSSRRTPCVHAYALSSQVDTSLYKLPLFTSRSALMPAATGLLTLYEPRYLQMLDDMEQQQQSRPYRFGHIITPDAAPPQLMADASIHGFPKVGVLATVKSITRYSNGTVEVAYEGARRFQILSILEEATPYTNAYCMHLADTPLDAFDQQDARELEEQVYNSLLDVAKLASQLSTDGANPLRLLPEAISKYAPTPQKQMSLSDALIDAGYSSAGHSIAMWQSQGSVYGKKSRKDSPSHDPYQMAADQLLGSGMRQELFSFAAAGCLELGNPEKLALLNSRDTKARLAWVLSAIMPFRAELQAKAALTKALGPASQGL